MYSGLHTQQLYKTFYCDAISSSIQIISIGFYQLLFQTLRFEFCCRFPILLSKIKVILIGLNHYRNSILVHLSSNKYTLFALRAFGFLIIIVSKHKKKTILPPLSFSILSLLFHISIHLISLWSSLRISPVHQ
jgi:hypothetical protein